MHPPSVDLIHLKASRLQVAGLLLDRYWFGWSNRCKGGTLVLCLELLDEAGQVIRESAISLPPVKVRGYVPPTDTRLHQLRYDADVRLQLSFGGSPSASWEVQWGLHLPCSWPRSCLLVGASF